MSDTFFPLVDLQVNGFRGVDFSSPELKADQVVTIAEQLYDAFDVLALSSLYEGLPYVLLEGMACGCFPVAGDLESIREWIENGRNGLLVDPGNPEELAMGIVRGLEDETLRRRSRDENLNKILERAEYGAVMAKAEEFYKSLLSAL